MVRSTYFAPDNTGLSGPDKLVELGYTPILIGGAPRSGTTFCSALLSTSESCNSFVPEFHYLYFLTETLAHALNGFDDGQHHFFSSKEALIYRHFSFIRATLDDAWEALGRPRNLVIKHCGLTPLFGLFARFVPQAKFVVIMRDARDVIASVSRGMVKLGKSGMTEAGLDATIARYIQYYQAILSCASSDLEGRLLALRYESVVSGSIAPIERFLEIDDIRPERLWQRADFDIANYQSHHLFSPLWGQPMSADRINTFSGTLSSEVAEDVLAQTQGTMIAFSSLFDQDHQTQ